MNRQTHAAFLIVAIAAAISFSGCARGLFAKRSKSAVNQSLFAVKAEKTSFYKFGPQQGSGPDRELPRDTVVTVIRQSMGYYKVRLEDGENGFVARQDLVRAPEKLIAHADTSGPDFSNLPPPPPVTLPVADLPSPEFEPTPLPQELMP